MKTNTEFKRDISIDRARGCAILVLIFFELLWDFFPNSYLSRAFDHAPDIFTITSGNYYNSTGFFVAPNIKFSDFGAVGFLCLIALTIIQSYNRKIKKLGKKNAFKQFFLRYIYILDIGILFSLFGIAYDEIIYIWPMYIFFIIFIIFVFLSLIYFIFKNKNVRKWIQIVLIIFGCYGILYNTINTLCLCLGLTEKYFGFWGVLQHIGFAGIIVSVIFYFLKNNTTKNRFFIGILILLIFTIFHETTLPWLANNSIITNNIKLLDIMSDGGVIGGIAYSGVLLVLTVFSDWYHEDTKKGFLFLIISVVLCILVTLYLKQSFIALDGSSNIFTLGYTKHFIPNKGSISPTYLLYAMTGVQIIFYIFIIFSKISLKFDLFCFVGKNPIIIYTLSFLLIKIFMLFNRFIILNNFILVVENILIFFCLIILGYYLNKKNIVIKI